MVEQEHELLADTADLTEHRLGYSDSRQLQSGREAELKRELLLVGCLGADQFGLHPLADARSELRREECRCQIVDVNIHDEVPSDLTTAVLAPVRLGEIAVPELAGLPETALRVDIKIDLRMGDDGDVDPNQAGGEAEQGVGVLLDESAGAEGLQSDPLDRAAQSRERGLHGRCNLQQLRLAQPAPGVYDLCVCRIQRDGSPVAMPTRAITRGLGRDRCQDAWHVILQRPGVKCMNQAYQCRNAIHDCYSIRK